MIQRIQSIWLLLAALCNAGLFFFALYRYDAPLNGVTAMQDIKAAGSDFLLFLLAIVITLLPFIDIFLFKNRKNQRMLAFLGIVLNLGFIAYMLMKVTNANDTSAPVNGSYWIGSVLPVVSTIFLFLAIRGIRKDEKLIKSLDRLR